MREQNKPIAATSGSADALSGKNMIRRSTTISAGVIFVIAASIAVLMLFAIYWFISVKSGVDTLNTYGYERLTYEGKDVEYGSFEYNNYYYAEFDDPAEYEKFEPVIEHFDIKFDDNLYQEHMGKFWLIEIISLLLAPLALIFAIMKTGPKTEDDSIYLNWFDKIFAEIDIAVIGLATILLYFPLSLSQIWFFNSEAGENIFLSLINNNPYAVTIKDWMDYSFFDRTINYAFEPRWILLVIAILGTVLIITVDLVAFLSIVRKIKAKSFLRTTILGSLIYAIKDNAALNPPLVFKVLGSLIGGILLMLVAAVLSIGLFGVYSVFFLIVGALIMIILVCVIVPAQIGKYQKVKTGISELQRGNFSYKVPNLGKGELGSLAESVNSISEAQHLAIQNELRSQRLRTELISNVSHDIRTPLTSIVSYVDLLNKEGLESPRAEEYFKIISEKTDRLKKLTDDLFEAAKASSGDIPVSIVSLDMHAMVEQALAELDESINKNKIEVILTSHTDNAMVYADGKLLWRVVENILTNVTKYSLMGTRAYMDIFEDGDKIVLEVKNMSKDQLNISSQELLERFKRGDSSRNTEGSGLGLAIASDLTALMGGEFNISIDGDLFKAIVSLKKAENTI